MTSPQQQHHSPQLTAAATQLLLLLLPLLSLLYSIAVHFFLSSFNERTLFKFHHWRPILTRVAFCCACGTLWWFTTSSADVSGGHYTDDDQDNATIIQLFISFIAAAVAIKLIIQTRQFEINGPPPPKPTSLNNNSSSNNNNSNDNNINNKVILITGANSGIGLETTRLLYHQYHATVILACRSRVRAMEAMEWIDPSCKRKNDRYNNNKSGGTISSTGKRIHFLPLDLTSISSIHTAVNILLKEMKISKLHVLINNAGVMMNERRVTVDGLEMTMAANVSILLICRCGNRGNLTAPAVESDWDAPVLTLSPMCSLPLSVLFMQQIESFAAPRSFSTHKSIITQTT